MFYEIGTYVRGWFIKKPAKNSRLGVPIETYLGIHPIKLCRDGTIEGDYQAIEAWMANTYFDNTYPEDRVVWWLILHMWRAQRAQLTNESKLSIGHSLYPPRQTVNAALSSIKAMLPPSVVDDSLNSVVTVEKKNEIHLPINGHKPPANNTTKDIFKHV